MQWTILSRLFLGRLVSSAGITVSVWSAGSNKVLVHYVEYGGGVPLVAPHGAGVDHREIEAAIEAAVPGVGYRRIYPDLPGMGRPTA